MIRLSRLADYGVVLMTHIAGDAERPCAAHAVAAATRIPEPTVSKVLKALSRHGLLESHRGVNGGYCLAREPAEISVTEIIAAVDGPIAMTDCLDVDGMACSLETFCPTRGNWLKINNAIRQALDEISLADMIAPTLLFPPPAAPGERRPLIRDGLSPRWTGGSETTKDA